MSVACQKPTESDRERLAQRYGIVRARSRIICSPLEPDDHGIQSMPDVSPPKWHLAHTSWFFETFILEKSTAGYRPYHPRFNYLFNSYYKGIGNHHPREERGLLSRPTLPEVLRYRDHVDAAMEEFLRGCPPSLWRGLGDLVELGLNHEEQHQELLMTDIKHILSCNPLKPAYQKGEAMTEGEEVPLLWIDRTEGIHPIGHDGNGFSFDNERPRHRIFLESHSLASRLVTNGEFLEFIADGGYREPRLWLSDGWDAVLRHSWQAPLYWEQREGVWNAMTLHGMQPLNLREPVVHVSYYEADAFAHWAGQRLPSEGEWEVAAAGVPVDGNFYESGRLHPSPLDSRSSSPTGISQIFGDAWEWTSSPYVAYPRFKPHPGNAVEYNGKFMCNQMVLRGGSCATPKAHIRSTYRNFFPPHARWQFTGIRLGRDV